jgi:DNA polymerase elongation subunit (family B)
LFFDIETGPIPVWVWDLNSKSNAHISHKNIIKGVPWGIICICWKWAGERQVQSLTWDQRQNDKRMIAEFIPVLDQATEILMHNGDRFDIPWIRGRAIYHRIPMRPEYPTLDTLKQSRRLFRFPSHRLDFLGQHLVNEEKVPVEFDLWKSIVEDKSPAGMAKMVKYCKQDVRLLEKVFDRMAPYVPPITHLGSRPSACPECGQTDRVIFKGRRTRKTGYVYIQLLCRRCPKWFGMPATRLLADKEF